MSVLAHSREATSVPSRLVARCDGWRGCCLTQSPYPRPGSSSLGRQTPDGGGCGFVTGPWPRGQRRVCSLPSSSKRRESTAQVCWRSQECLGLSSLDRVRLIAGPQSQGFLALSSYGQAETGWGEGPRRPNARSRNIKRREAGVRGPWYQGGTLCDLGQAVSVLVSGSRSVCETQRN